MLPSGLEYGRRLAGITPTALQEVLSGALTSAVIIVVDGLGWVNLRGASDIAPTLTKLRGERITTVAPSTTAAALTTITTGQLPGTHGLIGYKIRNPDTGTITGVLKEWHEITAVRDWQRCTTVFEKAAEQHVSARVYARPAHRNSGLTGAILTGATYYGAKQVTERFAALRSDLTTHNGIFYIYVDELDQAGHHSGAGSTQWRQQLRILDDEVARLLRHLPAHTGVILTADHGMVDIPASAHRTLDTRVSFPPGTRWGGEPRFRYLYLRDPDRAAEVAEEITRVEGSSCYAVTRQQLVTAGVFGDVDPAVLPRIGDVCVIARKRIAYYTEQDPRTARQIIGQHGGLDEDELGVPLLVAGDIDLDRFHRGGDH